jgi:hypothetical protein
MKEEKTQLEKLTEDNLEGFYELEDHLVDRKPPRIKLLHGFYAKSPEAQADYLLKIASSMNQAAKLVSDERNELGRLIKLKEQQLEKLTAQMKSNSDMLQSEVMRMNEYKQDANDKYARLHAENLSLKQKLSEWTDD